MQRISTVLLIASLALAAHAQTGEWGSRGNSVRFAVHGNFVMAADGRGVSVYDTSQSAPRRVSFTPTDSESIDLTAVGTDGLAVATREAIVRFSIGSDGTLSGTGIDGHDVASRIASNGKYVAGVTSLGVTVWDAATMSVVRRFQTAQPAVALAWHGDTLIAAIPSIGVDFLDPTGARDPILIPEDARDVAVSGDTLYAAAGVHGLATFDLSGAAPVATGLFGAGPVNFATVAVSDVRAFVTEQPDRVHVFDLTSGTPVLTATFNEPAQAIAAAGTRLFVSGMSFDAFGVAGNSGAPLRIFDASDPAAPHLAGEFRDLAGPVSGVATDGTLAYVADRPFFRVLDVSTTAEPRELSSLRIDDMGDRVKIHGDRVIVYGRGDVHLIDVSNPYAPRLLKVFVSHGGPPSGAAFARDTIIEANGYSGFHVVDFEHYPDARQIGGMKGHYSDAAADGDTVWPTYFGSALLAVDLSDPTNPRPVTNVALGGVQTVVVPRTANHPELLMVETPAGVHFLSVADRLHPVKTGFVPAAGVTALAAEGDVAYLAGSGFVQRVDLTDLTTQPAQMHEIAPMQMAAAAGKVVIADRYSLRIYGPNTAPPPPPPSPRHRVTGR